MSPTLVAEVRLERSPYPGLVMMSWIPIPRAENFLNVHLKVVEFQPVLELVHD